ncbi:hypothetical protein ACFPRL_07675 [Pseudoclavibacter helvolus]
MQVPAGVLAETVDELDHRHRRDRRFVHPGLDGVGAVVRRELEFAQSHADLLVMPLGRGARRYDPTVPADNGMSGPRPPSPTRGTPCRGR